MYIVHVDQINEILILNQLPADGGLFPPKKSFFVRQDTYFLVSDEGRLLVSVTLGTADEQPRTRHEHLNRSILECDLKKT